jgi:hypothetical protein
MFRMKENKGDTLRSTSEPDKSRNPLREKRCEDSASRALKGGKKGPPGPQGACSKPSRVEGSE